MLNDVSAARSEETLGLLNDSLDVLNLALLTGQAILLPFLAHNTLQYKRQYEREHQDPFTLATLFFLIMSLLFDVLSMPFQIFILVNDYTFNEIHELPRFVKCFNEFTWVGSIDFFNFAIVINATRWLLIFNGAQEERRIRTVKRALIGYMGLTILLEAIKVGKYCSLDKGNYILNDTFILSIVILLLIIDLLTTLFSLAVFIFAIFYFGRIIKLVK